MRKKISKEAAQISQVLETDTFVSPESSMVEGGTYDMDTGQTVIAFSNKGRAGAKTEFYTYEKVSRADWLELKNASSKGKAMQWFRQKYRGLKVTE